MFQKYKRPPIKKGVLLFYSRKPVSPDIKIQGYQKIDTKIL